MKVVQPREQPGNLFLALRCFLTKVRAFHSLVFTLSMYIVAVHRISFPTADKSRLDNWVFRTPLSPLPGNCCMKPVPTQEELHKGNLFRLFQVVGTTLFICSTEIVSTELFLAVVIFSFSQRQILSTYFGF